MTEVALALELLPLPLLFPDPIGATSVQSAYSSKWRQKKVSDDTEEE